MTAAILLKSLSSFPQMAEEKESGSKSSSSETTTEGEARDASEDKKE